MKILKYNLFVFILATQQLTMFNSLMARTTSQPLVAIPAELKFGNGRSLLKSVVQKISIANIGNKEAVNCQYSVDNRATFKYLDQFTCGHIKADSSCQFSIQAMPKDNKTEEGFLHVQCLSQNKIVKLKAKLSISGEGFFSKSKEEVIDLATDKGIPFESAHKLTLTPDGRNLYVTSAKEHTVRSFVILPKNKLAQLADLKLASDHTVDVAITQDGKFLYVASANPDKIAILNRDISIKGRGLLRAFKDDLNVAIKGISHLALSPDGEYLYATSAAEAQVQMFKRNLSNGLLVEVAKFSIAKIAYDRPFVISPDGKWGIFVGENTSEVSVVLRDKATGKFAEAGTVCDAQAPISQILISHDSKYAYNLSTSPKPNIYRMKLEVAKNDELEFVDLKKTADIENIVSGEISRDGRLFLLGHDSLRIFKLSENGPIKLVESIETTTFQNTEVKFNPRGNTLFGLGQRAI